MGWGETSVFVLCFFFLVFGVGTGREEVVWVVFHLFCRSCKTGLIICFEINYQRMWINNSCLCSPRLLL